MSLRNLQSELGAFLGSHRKARRDTHAKDRKTARRLADQLGVTLDVERSPFGWGCWILGPDAIIAPIIDDQFCSSWDEVVSKLQRLAA